MAVNRVINKLRATLLTDNYTIAISYNIALAFDFPSHQAIIKGCNKLKLPEYLVNIIHSYLCNRKAIYKGLTRDTEKGCPQGLVLSPKLWNITYDPILSILTTLGHVTCFADDTMIIISAPTIKELQHKYKVITQVLENFLNVITVQPNTGKTEILLLCTKYTLHL